MQDLSTTDRPNPGPDRQRDSIIAFHALFDRALAAFRAGRPAEAAAHYREALRLQPDCAEAHNNLGNALCALDRHTDAVPCYQQALALRPDYADAALNLGNALCELGRLEQAADSYRAVLRLRPDWAEAHTYLGTVLQDLGCTADAASSHRQALRLRPDYADAHNNLTIALCRLGSMQEAEASCRATLRLKPDSPEAHHNLAHALLLRGQYEEGWREYEWRWQTRLMAHADRGFTAPLWAGEPIGDRTILLHGEQGFGDTLQFCRYVPLVAARARVILEVQAPLTGLLARLPHVTTILARGEPLPAFDLHCPLASLPRAFATALDSIPADTPYLAADPARSAAWRARLAGLEGVRVGLVWAGGARSDPELAAVNARRSIAPALLAPLGGVAGVSLVSLQKGQAPGDRALPGVALQDFTDELCDFDDTAALVDNLDLVIGVDTAVVHLAGALGKPVWLLNRFDSCWRWMVNRDDSPWYPTLRQFRQMVPGDWPGVIVRVCDALRRFADRGR